MSRIIPETSSSHGHIPHKLETKTETEVNSARVCTLSILRIGLHISQMEETQFFYSLLIHHLRSGRNCTHNPKLQRYKMEFRVKPVSYGKRPHWLHCCKVLHALCEKFEIDLLLGCMCNHLGSYTKYRFRGHTPDLLNQNLWGHRYQEYICMYVCVHRHTLCITYIFLCTPYDLNQKFGNYWCGSWLAWSLRHLIYRWFLKHIEEMNHFNQEKMLAMLFSR